MYFFRIVRFQNLLIVAFTQYLLQYAVLMPALWKSNIPPALNKTAFFLLVLTTVLLAAGSYLINDLVDYEADKVNKPEKTFVQEQISTQNVQILYWFLTIFGFGVSIYLARVVQQPQQLLIYPVAVVLLRWYSLFFKKTVLLGNIVVAIFCAFVTAVILYAERGSIQSLNFAAPKTALEVVAIFGSYILFSFLTTMLREIIKDCEDVAGDRAASYFTLPVAYGTPIAKSVALFFGVLLLLLLCASLSLSAVGFYKKIYVVALLILPNLYILFLIAQAKSKTNFSKISLLSKLLMVAGLMYLVVFYGIGLI